MARLLHLQPSLGDLVRDTISGLEGIVTARTDYLHGVPTCTVQPREVVSGKPAEASYIPESQLEILATKAALSTPAKTEAGYKTSDLFNFNLSAPEATPALDTTVNRG